MNEKEYKDKFKREDYLTVAGGGLTDAKQIIRTTYLFTAEQLEEYKKLVCKEQREKDMTKLLDIVEKHIADEVGKYSCKRYIKQLIKQYYDKRT